ncbi:MAG: restriction endonuclease subunit S [Faecalibacterium sp.]|jgi:type I restriction enzyme S subunit
MAKLGEVCLLKAGKFVSANDISPEYNKGLYPCFGGNGIRGYVADYTHDGEFPLIGRQGALCGNVNLASGKFHATEHAVVVQPKIEMNVHWLYYAINAMNLGQYATGAAQPGLAVSKLETLSIEIPNISEQNKIAQTLYKVEQLVNFRKQQLAKLDELVKAQFVEMFGDINVNNKKWMTYPLGELCTIVRGGSPRPIERYLGGTIPWIKIGDATTGENIYLNSTKEYIIQEGVKKSRMIKAGSLIFANCGVSLGFARIITFDGCIHDGWLAMEDIDEKLDKIFLLYSLNQMTEYFRKTAPAGTQPNLNTNIMKMHRQIVPPMEMQKAFISFVKCADRQKQIVQQSLDKLELMKKALMQEYFG